MFYKIIKSSVLLVLVAFVFSACSLPSRKSLQKKPENKEISESKEDVSTRPPVQKTGKLKKFKDYSDLSAFLLANISVSSSEARGAEAEASLELDYFQDNDVDNVREADILKQAKNFSFALVKNELIILRLNDLDSSLLAKINFDSRPSGILSFGSSLIVYGEDEIFSKSEGSNLQFVQIFDLSTPAGPKQIHNLSFEGDLKDIFIEEGRLYVLTEKKAGPKLTEQVLPKVMSDARTLPSKCDGIEKCFAPEVFYFDTDYLTASFFNINVIDLENEFTPLRGQSYLLSENHQAYSSEASVFFSYFEILNEEPLYFNAQAEVLADLLTETEKNKIKEVEALSDFVLSPREKMLKISAIFEAHLATLSEVQKTLLEVDIKNEANKKILAAKVSNKTLIHKIRLSKDSLDYYAMGEVSGKMINNYSILQKGSYVYLATKSPERLNDKGENRYYTSVYVFDLALRLVGKMENLSSKEEIYGVRFLGNRAFLVSGEKNGSLFVISLEDKKEPEFAGTLKVPGENIYLRPLDQDGKKFISFSYSLDNSSGFEIKNGVKLSLFDFSDLKSPRELASYLIGDVNSDSLVFTDKKSFYYSDSLKTLIFPATFKEDNRLYFSGLFVFALENDSLELKGKLDHSLGGFYNQVDNFKNLIYFDNSVKRSFANKNFIYSFSNKFFQSADINNIDNAKFLELMVHSDDLLVSSFTAGNSDGFGINDGVNDDNRTDGGVNNEINPNYYEEAVEENYNIEENLTIPDYFEDPVYEGEFNVISGEGPINPDIAP